MYLQEQYCVCNILNWKHLLISNCQRPYGASLILLIIMDLVCSGDTITLSAINEITAVLQARVH